jgi:hypothetical protein
MHTYVPFLQRKLDDPSISVKARAMAAIALFQHRVAFDPPDFGLPSPWIGHNAWAGIMWPLFSTLSAPPGTLNVAETLLALQCPNGGFYLSTQENRMPDSFPKATFLMLKPSMSIKLFVFFSNRLGKMNFVRLISALKTYLARSPLIEKKVSSMPVESIGKGNRTSLRWLLLRMFSWECFLSLVRRLLITLSVLAPLSGCGTKQKKSRVVSIRRG